MAEYLQQNKLPINRQSKAALKALKLEANDELLYSLQLMNSGLSREKYRLMPENRLDLQEMVEDLLSDDPELAMKYLLETDLGEPAQLPSPELTPRELAQSLLANLHSKMAATLDNYPTTPPAPIAPLER